MLIRSIELYYMMTANKSREFLLQSKSPFLDIRWARVLNKEALIMTLEGHSGIVSSVAVTPDNSKIVSGSSDHTIKIWDMNTGKLLNTLEGHSSGVRSVAITSDNNKIVSGCDDKTIRVWDLGVGKCYLGHRFDERVKSIAFSKSTNFMALGDWNGNLYAGMLAG